MYVMGNLDHSCCVKCIEQALWGESLVSLSLEGTRVELLECGELDTGGGM